MPVQDVYKFTNRDDDRRIVAGTVESGHGQRRRRNRVLPVGKAIDHSRRSRRSTASLRTRCAPGEAAGFTLQEADLRLRAASWPRCRLSRGRRSARAFASACSGWATAPLVKKKDYLLKIGSTRVSMRLEDVHRVIDASNLGVADEKQIASNATKSPSARWSCQRAIAFDLSTRSRRPAASSSSTPYEISGGGHRSRSAARSQDRLREKVLLREYKWEPSFIPPERRAGRGSRSGRRCCSSPARRTLTARGWPSGLEVPAVRRGPGRLLPGNRQRALRRGRRHRPRSRENRHEHVRRLAEVANLMLDAGIILIVSAQELTQEDLELDQDDRRSRRGSRPSGSATPPAADSPAICSWSSRMARTRLSSGSGTLLVDKGMIFQPW